MPDRSAVAHLDLTKKQYFFLARKLGCFSNRPLLDVGGDGLWISELVRRGAKLHGIIDQSAENLPETVSVGSPAGSIKPAAHSMHRVLVRDLEVFQENRVGPETTIALANLLSCLKPRGRMIIPVASIDDEEFVLWKERLAGFPGKLNQRILKTGLGDYLSLAFLLRGIHQISVLEFILNRKPVSRLEWHRLAREAVMQRMQRSPAAA